MKNVRRDVRCVHIAKTIYRLRPHRAIWANRNRLSLFCSARCRVFFKKTQTNDTTSPKSAPSSNLLWAHYHLMNLVWVGVVPYTAIVFVNMVIRPKMCLVAKDDYSAKIGVLIQMLRSPLSEQSALFMVINSKLLGQLDLVRVYAQVPVQNSLSWSLQKAEFLCTARNWLLWVIWCSFNVQVLGDYQIGRLKFGHQMLESKLWKAIAYAVHLP